MEKKYIIAVSVVVVLWCGFMAYRHFKKKEDTSTYTHKMHAQITEAAKKAPRAGLTEMGSGLASYYNEHNEYPSNLMDLYPKHIPNKSLIEEIDWYYEPRGDDFYLSKTLTIGDKRIVASVDNGLRPQAETGVMVAAPKPPPKPKVVKKPEEVEAQVAELAESRETEMEKLELAREEFLKALRERQMYVASVSLPERDEARLIATVQPELLSTTEGQIAAGIESELSRKYLIWKDKNGVLGFSNVQYPSADTLAIHAIGRWYDVRMPERKPEEQLDSEIMAEKRTKSPEMIASEFSSRYLVWKDKHGTLGFGDGQYPETELASVFHADAWVSVKRPQPARDTGLEPDQGLQEKVKSPEIIASGFSSRHLVWKDKHGTLGFGNGQYPEMNDISYVHVDGNWEPVPD